ncbi:MAG: PEP-CTERM sorting domain-containing protein [Planctomycetia bacterium]|nr:MAG: PEP-CTERM sorting domain-containing protein [Planctomycetia bacterium]
MTSFKRTCIGIVGSLLFGVAAAQADVSETILKITAISSDGHSGSWSVGLPSATFNIESSTYNWAYAAGEGNVGIEILARDQHGNPVMDGDGRPIVLGELRSAEIELVEDPQVNLGFTLVAGNAATTTFLVQSALLSFPTLTNPMAETSGTLTVTDSFGFNGATMGRLLANAGQYRSEYNGFVPTGTTFADLIDSFSAGAGGSVSSTDSYTNMIAGTVSDMSAQVEFTLTRRDTASGTTDYRIVPEPASLLLLGLAALAVRRR